MAAPVTGAVWILPDVKPKFHEKSFGTGRPSGCSVGTCKRWHAGVDLLNAPTDTVVVAPNDGQIIRDNAGWQGEVRAIYLRTNNYFIVMGGIRYNSAAYYDVYDGDYVKAGQPIGEVAEGYNMIHFELYDLEVNQNKPWFIENPVPTGLLNPTEYVKVMAGQQSDWKKPPKKTGAYSSKISIFPLIMVAGIAYFVMKSNK